MNWNKTDYIVMGTLLLLLCLALKFVTYKIKEPKYKLISIMAAIVVFLLIWAELAVGIFGTPFAGS